MMTMISARCKEETLGGSSPCSAAQRRENHSEDGIFHIALSRSLEYLTSIPTLHSDSPPLLAISSENLASAEKQAKKPILFEQRAGGYVVVRTRSRIKLPDITCIVISYVSRG